MAFDLMLIAGRALPKRVSEHICQELAGLPGAALAEITPSDSKSVVVGFLSIRASAAPAEVKPLFAALVDWAQSNDIRLHDAQAGQDIDLQAPRDISLDFAAPVFAAEPMLVSNGPDWDIVVGDAGVVGRLRREVSGEVRLTFGDDPAAAIPMSWLQEKVDWLSS